MYRGCIVFFRPLVSVLLLAFEMVICDGDADGCYEIEGDFLNREYVEPPFRRIVDP